MKKEILKMDVVVLGSSDDVYPGTVHYQEWTTQEAFYRGFKKSAKIVGIVFGVLLPFAVLEPFMFMVWGGVVLLVGLFVAGPFLHFVFWSENKSFVHVDSECPACHKKVLLKPYLSTALSESFTVICSECGQTSKANFSSRTQA